MKSFLSTAICCFVGLTAVSQEAVEKIPTHIVKPPVYSHENFRTAAYIDSALFFRYIDWVLQKDSLPQQYREGKSYDITFRYIVSKEGKLSEVKSVSANEQEKELVEFIRTKLLAFPDRWYPATQNGRPVSGYFQLRLVGNK